MSARGGGRVFDRYRSQFPGLERVLYLNHASESPLSRPVRERIGEYLDAAERDPDDVPLNRQRLQELLAALIGAAPAEIALVPNTTVGLAIVANGLDWQPGDNVVLPEEEFPSNVRPWTALAHRGVEVRRVPLGPGYRLEPAAYATRIDRRTRAVALSHVEWLSGFRNDLRAIGSLAHAAGALFVVDAIQSFGAVAIDVAADGPIDVMAAGGYKWALGPVGTGFLYVRQACWDRIRPSMPGGMAVVDPLEDLSGTSPYLPSAGRYESGNLAWPLFHGWTAGLEMLSEAGPPSIEAHLLRLTTRIAGGVTALGCRVLTPMELPSDRAGILSFTCWRPERHETVYRELYDRQVIIARRGPLLRVSPHFYNHDADVDRFLEVLEAALRRSPA
jgi:cysteine desulfurase / selenocysteine lyase